MEKEVWTLSGELINCEGYEALLEAQEKLIEIFKEDLSIKSEREFYDKNIRL